MNDKQKQELEDEKNKNNPNYKPDEAKEPKNSKERKA